MEIKVRQNLPGNASWSMTIDNRKARSLQSTTEAISNLTLPGA
jgi:hypothetical protein